jgi:hypothetical protein
MIVQERIDAFAKLGDFIAQNGAALQQAIAVAYRHNPWFTPVNIYKSLQHISSEYLNGNKLLQWTSEYDIPQQLTGKTVAVVAAGNIPMTAFHDVLSVLLAGHRVMIKLSDKDKHLLPFVLARLSQIAPAFKDRIVFAERMEGFDGIIATGSNNTSRYFEFYFSKYRHIIRKNRNSIAVLNGEESAGEMEMLGADIFDYFGLGCRNVAKIFVPEGFDLMKLKTALMKYKQVNGHTQYMHNLDYQRTIYLMNRTPLIDIDFINIVENEGLHSPISCLYYEYYPAIERVQAFIDGRRQQIQCIVGNAGIEGSVHFGKSQSPALKDYADDIDTMNFLVTV